MCQEARLLTLATETLLFPRKGLNMAEEIRKEYPVSVLVYKTYPDFVLRRHYENFRLGQDVVSLWFRNGEKGEYELLVPFYGVVCIRSSKVMEPERTEKGRRDYYDKMNLEWETQW
jgi:hypothetical protein